MGSKRQASGAGPVEERTDRDVSVSVPESAGAGEGSHSAGPAPSEPRSSQSLRSDRLRNDPLYRRVLLKLSGDAFAPPGGELGISGESISLVANQLREIVSLGVQVAVVVGGGNIWRGRKATRMDRARADYIGMLATVMNALALQDGLEQIGVHTRVQTAIQMAQIAEPYIPLRAIRHLEKGRVVIFAAGMGVPFFSTDTTAAQRALEIKAEVILKATKVDGVYDSDPALNAQARKFETLEYIDVLKLGLTVMDATAISLCMENRLPIVVFGFREEGNLTRALLGEPIGTVVRSADEAAVTRGQPPR